MLFIELRTDLTVQQLAEACRTKENPLGMCPCAGFCCPHPEVDCDEVTAEHWAEAIQDDKPADITPEEARGN